MTENPKHVLDTTETPQKPSKVAKTIADPSDDEEEPEQQQSDSGIGPQSMSQNPKIQRYLIAIEYTGTRFSGSQQQLNCRTVVGVLQLPPHEPAVVKKAVNHFLQKNEGDIMVVDVPSVSVDFHARYKAQEPTYFYCLLSGSEIFGLKDIQISTGMENLYHNFSLKINKEEVVLVMNCLRYFVTNALSSIDDGLFEIFRHKCFKKKYLFFKDQIGVGDLLDVGFLMHMIGYIFIFNCFRDILLSGIILVDPKKKKDLKLVFSLSYNRFGVYLNYSSEKTQIKPRPKP
ncbi:hypothetical protein UlMin_029594 [Ulmus minor]